MNVITSNLTFKSKLNPLNLNNLRYIVIHHIEATTATPEDIHQWHLENGWSGAGYNEYIRKDGTVYILRGDNEGAHCTGYNSIGYGIALEGNFENEQINDAQLNSLIDRIIHNKNRLNNMVKVVGHRDLGNTSCPGRNINISNILSLVNKKESINTDWKEIIKKVASNPDEWVNGIEAAKNAAKADGNLGALEIFKFLPELIIKIHNSF